MTRLVDIVMADPKEIALSQLYKTKYIALDLVATEKPDIIAELVALVAQSGKIKNKKALTAALVERESLGSTAIGNGAAIPHAKIDAVKETLLVFGRSRDGVDFNSLDGEKTYIFFMLLSPKEDVGAHLKILAKISHLIKDRFTLGKGCV